MKPLALVCALALLLGACMRQAPLPPPSGRAPVLRTPEERVAMEAAREAPAAPVASAPLAAGLPARLREAAFLRPQPLTGAAVLQALPAGSAVSILGEIDNAGGRWSNVRVGDLAGWLPASALEPVH
ncbi:hypothetical protein ED208_07235 [Stagnimonas aquatica]|uniref:SH3 domain-containing protein n=1 Tax=Stagnimonas aquatica TaxID=2689987 RepID=A0A3N0VHF3_9GAMM|nr:hypothetical protein [Stagnimonas aquatica]ROH92152.1 hypothetical protein ED208_07235 [Stagnimonas aquatica]